MGGCRLPCLLPFCLDLITFGDKNQSICYRSRPNRLGTAGLSKSVTLRGLENVLLLQIETFGTWLGGMSQSVTSTVQKSVFLLQVETFVGGGNGDDGPFVRCGGDGSV